MAIMAQNWSAIFKDAAGNSIFMAGGYSSPMTMDVKTANTFLHEALVDLEEAEFKSTQRDGTLRDAWAKVVVEAAEFGIPATEFDRSAVSDVDIESARKTAEMNRIRFPNRIL